MGLPHMNTDPGFFNEPIAASDPIRVRQADQLLAYLRGRRTDRTERDALFAPDYASPEAYERSAAGLRAALSLHLGYPPPGASRHDVPETHEQTLGEDQLGNYRRIRMDVLPGVETVGLYMLPHGKPAGGRLPLIIAMHGGLGAPEIATFHGGQNYNDMVRGALAQGYAVFAPTHLHRTTAHPENIRFRVDLMARQVGTTLSAIEVWKISRALDALLVRPEIDAARVAMVGLSYGGYYTVLTMALETRIKAGVASCYARDETFLWGLSHPELHIDYAWMHGSTLLDNGALVSLICPRAIQLQHGTGDDIIRPEVSAQMAASARVHYDRLKLPTRLAYAPFAGWHEFNSALAWPFLREQL